MTIDSQQLADRYAAVWNEPDPAVRRAEIEQLWRPDGEHFVKTKEARGHAALEERVSGAYDKNVRIGGHAFRAVRNAQRLHDVITFNWEMVDPATLEVLAVGLEFLRVDTDGRIVSDHQFIVS
jgi:hypothetical protein